MNDDNQIKPFTIAMSEPEIKMVIQNIIDDLGDVKSAKRWIRNNLHSINFDILKNGYTIDAVQSRDQWAIIDRYVERHYHTIVRAQQTKQKFNP
jgi:hypothetical protein